MKLHEAVSDYIALRRREGSPFVSSEITLRSFCRHCGDIHFADLTAEIISSFANNPKCAPATRISKYSGVKCFVEHLRNRGGMHALSLDRPAKPTQARTPFIYTRTQVSLLLNGTARCQAKAPELNAKTFRLFLLMLYTTGATVDEVLRLRWSSVDLRKRLIRFSTSSSMPSRSLPVGSDFSSALLRHRNGGRHADLETYVLQGVDGGPVNRKNLHERFRRLRLLVDLGVSSDGHLPRLQDLRYTFAVHRLNTCIRRGEDLNKLIPALSTYMGYRSLTAAEQFLAFVPNRFKGDLEKLSPAKGRKRWSKDAQLMEFLSSL